MCVVAFRESYYPSPDNRTKVDRPLKEEGIGMIEHTIITAKHYAYITIKQSPDLATFIRASRLFVGDPDYSASLNRVCDFSQADLSHITESDLAAYIKFAIEEVSLAPGAKVALVAPSPEKAGIFERFAGDIDQGVFHVFFHPQDAVDWIRAGNRPTPPADGADLPANDR